MKISTKTRYGTRAMVDIGEHYGEGPVSLRELAERQGVSMKYMEQIVPSLKASGLVRSARGAQGGYVLAKEPQDITLHDIVHALVGSWSLVDCLDDETLCDRTQGCVTYEIWHDIQTAIYRILDSTTLADMIKKHQRKVRACPPSKKP
ncbi:MAG: Rrf2 family transcriptional regulator [Thermodesulfobacteriota bacterium]|nr:Rrf2 family transcriptional regulator [Thermodesulfobacteriota bacterium]